MLSAMTHLNAYAKWLEDEGVRWWDFPSRESDRCLVRFRGALMNNVEEGCLAPSTASHRMSAVIRFYRWLHSENLLSPEWPMWNEKVVGVRLTDSFGFERTLITNSTDLAIPNRKASRDTLEGGLLPVSLRRRNAILTYCNKNASQELTLMLGLGFRTGMRLGTICDLKIKTLQRAVPDPSFPGWFRIAVGPGAHPPVHTKYGVTGQIWIDESDLQAITSYSFEFRRLNRQARAAPEHREHVFLTRNGAPYGADSGDKSNALNVELHRLRRRSIAEGIEDLRNFHFHQSRCTFATEIARLALKHGNANQAISFVKQALLHRDESTTLKYIRFVENNSVMASAADEFTKAFVGFPAVVEESELE